MFTQTNTARFVATPSYGKGFVHWLLALIAAHKTRTALANLDAHALKDVALTTSDVQAELARPLWDVPATWQQ